MFCCSASVWGANGDNSHYIMAFKRLNDDDDNDDEMVASLKK